jgi:hypothetical protein
MRATRDCFASNKTSDERDERDDRGSIIVDSSSSVVNMHGALTVGLSRIRV